MWDIKQLRLSVVQLLLQVFKESLLLLTHSNIVQVKLQYMIKCRWFTIWTSYWTTQIQHCSAGRILGRNRDKSLKNFLLAIHSHLYRQILIHPPPPFPEQKWFETGLKLVCNVNIVYSDLNSDNSKDYAQKPQQNCTFMNSAFGTAKKNKPLEKVQVQYCSETIRMMVFMNVNPTCAQWPVGVVQRVQQLPCLRWPTTSTCHNHVTT